MPCGQKYQNIKQKQYCNKFNEDFKNGSHQKKPLKKIIKLSPRGSLGLILSALVKKSPVILLSYTCFPILVMKLISKIILGELFTEITD